MSYTASLIVYSALSLLLALVQGAKIRSIKSAIRGRSEITHPISVGCVLTALSDVLSPVWLLATLYMVVQVASSIYSHGASVGVDAGFVVLLLAVLLVGGRVPNRYATNTSEAALSPWWWLAAAVGSFAIFYALGWIG